MDAWRKRDSLGLSSWSAAGSAGSAVAGGAERERPLSRAAARGRRGRSAGSGSRCRWARASCCYRERSLWRFYTEPEAELAGRRDVLAARARARRLFDASTACCGCAASPPNTTIGASSAIPAGGTADVLPFLKRMEAYARGRCGRCAASRARSLSPASPATRWATAFHAACVEAGVPATPDYNGAPYEGVGYLQSNTKRGRAHGGREAYFDPARGRATCACAPAHARTASRSRKARRRRRLSSRWRPEYFARAAREVIVSAGAVQSPQLLELSGIGDKAAPGRSLALLPSPTCRASARTAATICTRAYLSSARARSP